MKRVVIPKIQGRAKTRIRNKKGTFRCPIAPLLVQKRTMGKSRDRRLPEW